MNTGKVIGKSTPGDNSQVTGSVVTQGINCSLQVSEFWLKQWLHSVARRT